MAMYEICERCDRREHHWLVREARIEIGELNRKPHLCGTCTDAVTAAVRSALRLALPMSAPPTEGT